MVVLATKMYVHGSARERAIRSLESQVQNVLGELDVTVEIGIRHDGFPSVTVQGVDATVARAVLREEWAEITPELSPDERYIGTLESWDDGGFELDAGRSVRIPVDALGLGPGSPAQLVERFGLVQHQRLAFVNDDPPRLAEEERDRLYDWRRGAGRVNVNSVTRAEVRAAVNRSGHANDIVTVERLGLLEQSIVCRAETDPPGLLSAIGPYLPGEMRCVVTRPTG